MTAEPRRIGILGGTFDPIHCGHLDLGGAAERALRLTRVFVVTANVPPHRPQPQSSAFHRFAMVALAVLDRPQWRATDLELRSDTPSYTAFTLARFHERGFEPRELFFILGADAFADIASWRDYPQILDATNFAVVSRPGFSVHELPARLPALARRMTEPAPHTRRDHALPLVFLIDQPTADVSSTAIRERLAARQSIDGLVPPSVQQHIEHHALYASATPGRRAMDAATLPAAGRLHGQE
jgi:nicotinate-nucleotide adenylyltransferase